MSGTVATMVVPPRGADLISNPPSTSATRSRIDVNPRFVVASEDSTLAGSNPIPSSNTSNLAERASLCKTIRIRFAEECTTAFRTASYATR